MALEKLFQLLITLTLGRGIKTEQYLFVILFVAEVIS